MATVKWAAPTAVTPSTVGVDNASINAAAGKLGSEYNNETGLNRWALPELRATHGGGAPSGRWLLYFITAADGTNYEDGGDSLQPARAPDGVLRVRGVTTAQRIVSSGLVPLPPHKVKALVWNDTDVNATAVYLHLELVNEEVG